MENESPNYEESLKEVQEILIQLESGEAGIDEMSVMVKRASFLLENCQTKLRTIEKDLEDTFGEDRDI